MPSARFEHAIPAINCLQTYTLHRTATGIVFDYIQYQIMTAQLNK